MTEPNQKWLSDESIPRVKLLGKQWPIPHMAIKQNNVIAPIIWARQERAKKHREIIEAGGTLTVTEEMMVEMATVVYQGLTRGHKEFTRAEFDDWELDVFDMLTAVPIVLRQTGLLKNDETPATTQLPAATPQGEATGESQTGSQ